MSIIYIHIIKLIFIFLFSFLSAEEFLSKFGTQYDYFSEGQQQPTFRQQPLNYGNNFGINGDTVNFDFLCKCQAKSSLTRTNTPSSGDSNSSTQQQVQQLQEQVRKLQEQINKSQQGKSSFEQFSQMLSLADGLDCNCSGHSTPWTGWPTNSYGGNNNNIEIPNNNYIPNQIIPSTNNRIINPLSVAGNGGGQYIPMGAFRPSMGGWTGGGQQPHQQQFGNSGQYFPYPQTIMSDNLKKKRAV